jgi:hypothetical protein
VDIFFKDSSEIPLPPDEVRIRLLRAEPWPDGRRVRIYFEVDPFQKRPSAEVVITDSQGMVAAQASVIESMVRKMEFNMHLRHDQPAGRYTVTATLYYNDPIPEPGSQKEAQEARLPASSGSKSSPESEPLPEAKAVDQAETSFTIDVS